MNAPFKISVWCNECEHSADHLHFVEDLDGTVTVSIECHGDEEIRAVSKVEALNYDDTDFCHFVSKLFSDSVFKFEVVHIVH